MMFLSFALAFLVGLAMVCAADPIAGVGPRWARVAFRSSLGLGAGMAVTSILFFLLRMAGWANAGVLVTIEVICISLLVWRRQREHAPDAPAQRPHRALIAASTVAMIAVVARETQLCLANQWGEWDAMAEWNLRAKYLAGPYDWRTAASPLLSHTHPEYPLLLSAFIARCWSISGAMSPLVPAVTSVLYFVALLGLLVSGLTLLRGVAAGLIGGMVLVSMAPLLQWATAQYADVPLAYEFLAVLLLLFLDGRTDRRSLWALVWAGFFAGAAAWTKQEGAVFLAAILIASLIAERFARWRWLLAGAAPGMLLALWFKLWIAPQGDLAPQSIGEIVAKIKDPARYAQIGTSLLHRVAVMGWGPGHPLILLAILTLLLRRDGSRRYGVPVWVCGSALGAMLLAYCVVFVITPRDLAFHLNAWDRLLLQLWPGIVLLFCRLLPDDGAQDTL